MLLQQSTDSIKTGMIQPVGTGIPVLLTLHQQSFLIGFFSTFKPVADYLLLVIHNSTPSLSTAFLNGNASYSGEDHSSLLRIILLTTSSFSNSISYRPSFSFVMLSLSGGMIGDDQKIPVSILPGCIGGHGNRAECTFASGSRRCTSSPAPDGKNAGYVEKNSPIAE